MILNSPPIKRFIRDMEWEQLVLPAMQRPFVWEEERILSFWDGLLGGFPTGSFLTWDTNLPRRYRPFEPRVLSSEPRVTNFKENDGEGTYRSYVLDGQHRLTSIFLGCRGSLDGRRLYLNLLSGAADRKVPGDRHYDFRFLSSQQAEYANDRGSPYYPVADLFSLVFEEPAARTLMLAQLKRRLGELSMEEQARLDANVDRFTATVSELGILSVQELDEFHGFSDSRTDDILKIFARVHSGRKDLQESDLFLSTLDPAWIDAQPLLLRAAREASRTSPVEITRDMMLKSCLLLVDEETRFGVLLHDQDRLGRIAPLLEEALDRALVGWKRLGPFLLEECRIHSEHLLRGASGALVPFCIYLAGKESLSSQEKADLVTAVYMTLLSGVFNEAESRMGRFSRERCKEADRFPLEILARLIRETYGIRDLDALLNRHVDLALNIAQDGLAWESGEDPPERDHVFPKAALEQRDFDPEMIHHYANFHFLRAGDEPNRAGEPPRAWFRQPGRNAAPYSDADMEARLIRWEWLKLSEFPVLIEERGRAIREKALELFQRSGKEFRALMAG